MNSAATRGGRARAGTRRRVGLFSVVLAAAVVASAPAVAHAFLPRPSTGEFNEEAYNGGGGRRAAEGVRFDGDPATTEVVDTASPVDAAVALSAGSFGDGQAPHAVLSRDDEFADSLAGSPLTAEGPLLFTPSDRLAEETRAELNRVVPAGGVVYLLGGVNAISEDVAQQLRDDGFDVRRLAGASRIETALAVADEVRRLYPDRFDVGLARAFGPPDNPTAAWADAVSAGWWAARDRLPLLLTPTEALHPAVAIWLDQRGADFVLLFGGHAALSPEVEQAVAHPSRVAGAERSGTAAAMVRRLGGLIGAGPRRFAVIDGYRHDGWAFGLAAAGVGAREAAPLLLVNGDAVPEPTAALVSSCVTAQVDLLLVGSAEVVTDAAHAALDALDPLPCDTGPGAYAVRVQGEIDASQAEGEAPEMDVWCEPPPAVGRGTEMRCVLDVRDNTTLDDEPALVVVRDDAGAYNWVFGEQFLLSGEEALELFGPGRFCRDVAEFGATYFEAVLYWFAEGEPARMDADANGIPCETVYPADEIHAYWTS